LDIKPKVRGALLICFLREANLNRIIGALSAGQIEQVYVWIDGARNEVEAIQQENLKKTILAWHNNFSVFKINHQPRNLGLNKSIQSGIDWFFENVEHGIILEDDIVFEDDFLYFINTQKEFFDSKSDLLLISGHNPNPQAGTCGYVPSNYPLIWGWYTNIEKWKLIKDLISGSNIELSVQLPVHVSQFWKSGIRKVDSGKLNSWALPFAYRMRASGYYAISPHVNLISNLGLDKYATHTVNSSKILGSRIEEYKVCRNQVWVESDAKSQNRYLEKYVYQIRLRHSFLPVKDFTLKMIEKLKK